MSVQGLLTAPTCHAHFPAEEYVFLRLYDVDGTYAHAAVAERETCLELHLEMVRWGPQTRRGLAQDVEWLKARARALGKSRITGLRQETADESSGRVSPDPRWPKFTRMFGFTGQCVLQAAFLDVDEEASSNIRQK